MQNDDESLTAATPIPVPPNAPPAPTRIVRSVPPETAALVREEDEALAATLAATQALVASLVATANQLIAGAQARHTGATRAVLRGLRLDDGKIVAVDGFGDAMTLTIECAPAAPEAAAHA